MAEDKKVTPATKPAETAEANTTATVKTDAPAEKPVEAKAVPAPKKTAAKKPAVKKEAEKKDVKKAPAKTVSAAKKAPAAKKAVAAKTTAKATAVKKTPAKKAPARKAKAEEKSIDVITTALWKKISKADVKKMSKPLAIQVEVEGFGVFHIEIEENGEKHINPTEYNDRNGLLVAPYGEMVKIASGKYDYVGAVKKGLINYHGDFKKAVELAELLK